MQNPQFSVVLPTNNLLQFYPNSPYLALKESLPQRKIEILNAEIQNLQNKVEILETQLQNLRMTAPATPKIANNSIETVPFNGLVPWCG